MRRLLTTGSMVLLFLAAVSSAQAVPITINFDALDTTAGPVTGAVLDAYLAGFGVTITNQVPAAVVQVTNPTNMGGWITPASPPNFLWNGNVDNNPISYQLNFSTPLDSFVFTRLSNSALDSPWDARALDSNGTTIATVAEGWLSAPPAVTFTLNPALPISAVVFERTIVNCCGGLNNPPTDNWVLTTEPVPEPGTMLLLGSGLLGAAAWAGRRRFRNRGQARGGDRRRGSSEEE